MHTVPMMDFPLAEYEMRKEKLQQKMAEAGVDGVLLTQEENLRYFCGARSTAWESKVTPVCLLIMAQDGRMAMVTSRRAEAACRYTACLEEDEFFPFDPQMDSPAAMVRAVTAAFSRLGLSGRRIGVESGMVARISIAYREYCAIQAALPGCTFIPFAQYIWQLRSIKSPREVDVFRKVCEISGKCYQKAFDSVVLDKTTEKDVYHIFSQEAFRLGADSMPPLIVQFGQGRYTQANCPPSDKVITSKKHEFLFIDTGPALKGYITDTIRMAVVDSMTPRQADLRKMADEALEFCLDMIRDGVNCRDVSAKMDAMIEAKGFGPWNQTKGWTGHGLGLDIHEPPTLSCDCDMPIRSGMILSVEPLMMDRENGIIATEFNILVTDTGYVNLTPWLRDMVIL